MNVTEEVTKSDDHATMIDYIYVHVGETRLINIFITILIIINIIIIITIIIIIIFLIIINIIIIIIIIIVIFIIIIITIIIIISNIKSFCVRPPKRSKNQQKSENR